MATNFEKVDRSFNYHPAAQSCSACSSCFAVLLRLWLPLHSPAAPVAPASQSCSACRPRASASRRRRLATDARHLLACPAAAVIKNHGEISKPERRLTPKSSKSIKIDQNRSKTITNSRSVESPKSIKIDQNRSKSMKNDADILPVHPKSSKSINIDKNQ